MNLHMYIIIGSLWFHEAKWEKWENAAKEELG